MPIELRGIRLKTQNSHLESSPSAGRHAYPARAILTNAARTVSAAAGVDTGPMEAAARRHFCAESELRPRSASNAPRRRARAARGARSAAGLCAAGRGPPAAAAPAAPPSWRAERAAAGRPEGVRRRAARNRKCARCDDRADGRAQAAAPVGRRERDGPTAEIVGRSPPDPERSSFEQYANAVLITTPVPRARHRSARSIVLSAPCLGPRRRHKGRGAPGTLACARRAAARARRWRAGRRGSPAARRAPRIRAAAAGPAAGAANAAALRLLKGQPQRSAKGRGRTRWRGRRASRQAAGASARPTTARTRPARLAHRARAS